MKINVKYIKENILSICVGIILVSLLIFVGYVVIINSQICSANPSCVVSVM